MTFNTLCGYLIELREISGQDTPAGDAARKLLAKDPTTHNVGLIKDFVIQHSRNR